MTDDPARHTESTRLLGLMMLDQQLIDEEEGSSSPTVYYVDGLAHIARGCCIDGRRPGARLCQAALDAQDAYDLEHARELAQNLPGFDACNDVRKAVLVSMTFQLGTLFGWPRFKAALAVGNYSMAADEMLYSNPQAENRMPSQWAIETPARAQRQAAMMRSGLWVDK